MNFKSCFGVSVSLAMVLLLALVETKPLSDDLEYDKNEVFPKSRANNEDVILQRMKREDTIESIGLASSALERVKREEGGTEDSPKPGFMERLKRFRDKMVEMMKRIFKNDDAASPTEKEMTEDKGEGRGGSGRGVLGRFFLWFCNMIGNIQGKRNRSREGASGTENGGEKDTTNNRGEGGRGGERGTGNGNGGPDVEATTGKKEESPGESSGGEGVDMTGGESTAKGAGEESEGEKERGDGESEVGEEGPATAEVGERETENGSEKEGDNSNELEKVEPAIHEVSDDGK